MHCQFLFGRRSGALWALGGSHSLTHTDTRTKRRGRGGKSQKDGCRPAGRCRRGTDGTPTAWLMHAEAGHTATWVAPTWRLA